MTVLIVLLLAFGQERTSSAAHGVAGVFEGRTPCGPVANAFTGFPVENCEKIKWELSLRAAQGAATGTYEYRGTRASHQGTWRIQRDAGPERTWTVIHLHGSDSARRALSLLLIDGNVLVLLDGNLKPLVGDASWSYVLNRTDRRR